jgi:hypothetical protein
LFAAGARITCKDMPKTNAQIQQAHRERLRAQGLRPVQLWLPDTRTPEFAAQVAHDIAVLAQANPEDDALLEAFNSAVAEDFPDWT